MHPPRKSSSPYENASTLLNKYLDSTNAGLKQIYFNSKDPHNKNKLGYTSSSYAIVSEVLKHLPCLKGLVEKYAIENRNVGLTYVLLYELLFSKFQKIRGGGALVRKIKSLEVELRGDIPKREMKEVGVRNELVSFPRYVRVNTCKMSLEEAVQALRARIGASIPLYHDAHVPNLILLPPKTILYDMEEVKDGRLILQDKSSCFPSLILMNGQQLELEKGVDVMDACAAPGNKTSHLASFLYNNKGSDSHLYAVERDAKRMGLLKKRMGLFLPQEDSSCDVTFLQEDFLSRSDSNIQYLLLDPSCSSSGVVNQHNNSHKKTKEDIIALSNFQIKALVHAMTNFPSLQRIVYSTCSVNKEENEIVVSKCINECGVDWCIQSCGLSHWTRRGIGIDQLEKEDTDKMIRCNGLDGDETNGFFVCLLERRPKNEEGGEEDADTVTDVVENPIPTVEGISIYNGEFSVEKGDVTNSNSNPKKTDIISNNPSSSEVAQTNTNKTSPNTKTKNKNGADNSNRSKKKKKENISNDPSSSKASPTKKEKESTSAVKEENTTTSIDKPSGDSSGTSEKKKTKKKVHKKRDNTIKNKLKREKKKNVALSN